MPNILVTIKGNNFRVYNASEEKYVDTDGVSFEVDKESMILKMPLAMLGDPQRLLFGFETDPNYMPEGCAAFRLIRIE